jgi:hypothetical protein
MIFYQIFTAVLTAVLGLLGDVAGQIVLKLCEPAIRLRALFGAVGHDLLFLRTHRNFFE